jgi:hypothetical protein
MDFESLTLLYKINAFDATVKQLAFSGDGFRVVDIRDTKTKIWEPSALIRKTQEEDSSVSDAILIPAQVVGSEEESIEITALIAHPTQDVVIVGKDDGTVGVYDSRGQHTTLLYSHARHVYVTTLALNETAGLIASADVSSTVVAWTVKDADSPGLVVETQILKEHCDQPIRQLMWSHNGSHLLISTATHDNLWTRSGDGLLTKATSIHLTAFKMWKWIELPNTENDVLLVTESGSLLSSWITLHETENQAVTVKFGASEPETKMNPKEQDLKSDAELKVLAIDASGRFLVVDVARTLDRNVTDHLAVYLIDDIHSNTEEQQRAAGGPKNDGHPAALPPPLQEPLFTLSSKDIKYFLSITGSKLVFLDNNLGLCSIDLPPRSMSSEHTRVAQEGSDSTGPVINRHFFIPLEYIGGNNGVTGTVLANGDVVFPKEGEVVIVKEGLKWSQEVNS